MLLKSEILYDFIWGTQLGLFGDYNENISWLKWNYLCFDVSKDNENFLLKMTYGPIFLLLPFNFKLEISIS